MLAVDHKSHIPRPSMPTTKTRLSLAAAMHFLEVMQDRDPSIDSVHEDSQETLLPRFMLGQLAEDFMYAKRDMEINNSSYFFENERFTLLTALVYLSDLIDNVGAEELAVSLQTSQRFRDADAFAYHGVELMDKRELSKVFNSIRQGQSIDQLRPSQTLHMKKQGSLKNPYQGVTLDGESVVIENRETAVTPGM